MTHRFPIKEIARQAGLGTATVDRALNGRAHVSVQTRNRVFAAISELETQETQLAAKGRRLFIDFVVEAPERFTREIRVAADRVVRSIGFAVFRPRYTFHETMSEGETVAILERIAKRGSHGVCLKARNVEVVRKQVDALHEKRIPVATLVTDLPGTGRVAYAGLDNYRAGQTAAFLLANILPQEKTPDTSATVLAVRGREDFYGEAERFSGFSGLMAGLRPDLKIVDHVGGAGLSHHIRHALPEVVAGIERLDAVYSMGGGNREIIKLLSEHGHKGFRYLGHDLDRENRYLLDREMIDFVLHHDLEKDIRNLMLALGSSHGLHPSVDEYMQSDVQIFTRFNLPSAG